MPRARVNFGVNFGQALGSVMASSAYQSNNRHGLLKRISRARWAYFFIAPCLLTFLVFQVYPILYSFYLSLTRYDVGRPPQWNGLRNYRFLYNDDAFWAALQNTLWLILVLVPLGIALALLLSALIFKLSPTAQTFFKSAYYLPAVVSAVVVSFVWLWIYHPVFGLLNALLRQIGFADVLWLSQRATALPALMFMTLAGGGGASVVLYLAAMGAISPDLYEAAKIDGANERRQFWYITVPLLKPTTIYLLVVGVIATIQFFTPVYIMTDGGPANATVSLGLLVYHYAFRFNRLDVAATLGVLIFAVTIVLVFALYRLFFWDVDY